MFETLAIDWTFNPTAFTIFDIEVRYYGLMWALTILVSTKLFDFFCTHEGLSKSISDKFFIYAMLGLVLGARIGHCLFYEPENYLVRPWEIFTNIRNGGMASHGAALGMLIGIWLFSRKTKISKIWTLDRVMVATGLGGMIIRLGNLFNSEIFGHTTDLPWGFRFHQSALWQRVASPLACHPTQLYEALCYLLVFVVTMTLYLKYDLGRRHPGALSGVAIIGIFLSRFFIEFLKFNQVEFEQGMILDMGQWLSIPFIMLGAYMIYYAYKHPKRV